MKRLKMLSWNVNGLRAVHNKSFLPWFKSEAPDILCLQETKAHPNQLPPELLEVAGYQAYFVSAERKGYSGVALYSRIKPESIKTGLDIERFDLEGRTLIAEYKQFTLFNIYYPNGKASRERLQYKMDYYEAFLGYLLTIKNKKRNIIICGDVNTAHKEIDLARPRENEKVSGFLPEERAWLDRLVEHGFMDTFRLHNDQPGQYTWWDMKSRARERNIGWRIDYFFVSDNLKKNVTEAFIMPEVAGSDHCPVGIEITF